MHVKNHIVWLSYTMAVAISLSLAFTLDTTTSRIATMKQKDFFINQVLQILSGKNKGVVVTTAQQQERIQTHRCLIIPEISLTDTPVPVKHFGLSVAEDTTHSQLTVCKHENSNLSNVCYKMTDLQQIYQEWKKKTVDLVFLVDGSGSMTAVDFYTNKYFIVDIINSLKNSSIKFAAVQFATDYRKVFDFNDYHAGTALDKLMNEPHMKGLTYMYKALTFVLDHLFESRGAGASPDATKVLVIITDGDPSDLDRRNIVQRYDEKNVIRFVIGVRVATMEKFKAISSQPPEKYVFKIENYDGLKGILENFHKKISVIEGDQNQSGLSAVFFNDTLMMGLLGSNSWRGSLQEIHEGRRTRIENPGMDCYMGQSICVGKKNNDLVYFTGAPRFGQTGQVVVFRHNCMNWTPGQRLNGAQIGSYFGAELCSVDIDSDGNTDFLLVGAPLFQQPQEKTEGQIYIYRLTDEMQLEMELNVTAPAMGRFGTTIASLADLNGDGLRDVAVGAPLEDDSRGAVYIYLGDRHRGISSTFSQRITGQQLQPGLRFFAQAIDGDMDTGEHGLPKDHRGQLLS